jgi:hypothetical protein
MQLLHADAPSKAGLGLKQEALPAMAQTVDLIDEASLLAVLPEFISIFRQRTLDQNNGGMGFNHSFATFAVARHLKPKHIVESGVFRGHSTWLLEQACPDAEIYALDPDLSARSYISPRVRYAATDFASCDWSTIDRSQTLCFFDDHQSAYARLKDMRWWGFKWAIFEDNYPCGEGDCYSLRHVLAGFGHRHINMSKAFPGNPLKRARRTLDEVVLNRAYDRQEILRRPNAVDAIAVERNLAVFQELPPVVRYPKTIWDTDWDGPYLSKPALIPDMDRSQFSSDLGAFEAANPGKMFHYNYICAVGLR